MSYVLITGTSSGIGYATASYLYENGFTVLAGVRKQPDGDRLQQQIGERIIPVILDMTDAASISAAAVFIESATDRQGLSGLVNNAGVSYPSILEYVDIDATRRMLETNLLGPMALISACLPLLKSSVQKPAGRIVNVSSGAGQIAIPLGGTYSASKYALEGYSDALRVELRQQGIKVSVIEPGFVESAIHGKTKSERDSLMENLTAEGEQLYRAALDKNAQNFVKQSQNATSADEVAKAIHHALTAVKPKTRYAVGPEAKLLSWIKPLLSDRLRDMIVGRMVGL